MSRLSQRFTINLCKFLSLKQEFTKEASNQNESYDSLRKLCKLCTTYVVVHDGLISSRTLLVIVNFWKHLRIFLAPEWYDELF